jgi:regulatory protein
MSGLDTQDATMRRALALTRRYLRYGTRSTAQCHAYLAARSIDSSLVTSLIARCTQEGWLDDAACARLWAGTLRERGYALSAIHTQLQEQGLADAVIAPALDRLRKEADDARWAAELVRRKRLARGPQARPQQVARWLAQRGFDEEMIAEVVSDS